MALFCDVDGTLTDAPGHANGNPRPDVIAALKQEIASGEEVVVWSARGKHYCQGFCKANGIKGVTCVTKPAVLVDDFVERHGRGFRDDWRMKWLTPAQFAEGSWRK